jgi:hypothetical protein
MMQRSHNITLKPATALASPHAQVAFTPTTKTMNASFHLAFGAKAKAAKAYRAAKATDMTRCIPPAINALSGIITCRVRHCIFFF